jgi:hypothetical protein
MKKITSIASALSVSLFIYLFYRSEKTVVNELMIFVFSFETYTFLKNTIIQLIPLPKAIVYSLPGGLWIFCATALSQDFYLKMKGFMLQLAFVPVVFALGLEFCQLAHLTNGRFDIRDISCYVFFWLLAYLFFPSQGSQQNIASPFTVNGFICLACFHSVYLAHVNQ